MEEHEHTEEGHDGGDVLELSTKREDESKDVATIVLFRLDGKEFRVPAEPKPVVALRYLHGIRKHGPDVAAADLLAALLGEEAWEALVAYDDLTPDEFQAILGAVHGLVAGAVEGPAQKGFSSGQ